MHLISRQLLFMLMASAIAVAEPATSTLRKAFADDFLIGVAMNTPMVNGRNAKAGEIAANQFSALTAENDMKWQSVHPEPGNYQFEAADAYVEFGKTHNMAVIGHTLVWHSQTPGWVFQGKDGKPATREELLERMRDHILTVVGRYRGRVKGWDVVNEAISDGPERLRESPWRRIIGDDFLDQAFRFAHEADPDAELYYNDYGLENPGKRGRAIEMLRGLIKRGVPITGVGTQGHYSLDQPVIEEVERTINDFAALGLKVMITELDVDVLPSRGNAGVADISRKENADPALNPYVGGLPDEIQQKLAKRYGELFAVFLRHQKDIERVTFWGLDDGHSWLNGFPIQGRTNHPLLINRELLPKPAFFEVLKLGKEIPASR
ncbi:MAG: endo-1,4-beta-xylanase, partial [Luteolibacter sp.]